MVYNYSTAYKSIIYVNVPRETYKCSILIALVFLISVSTAIGQTTIGLRGGLNKNISLGKAQTSTINASESSWIFNKSLYGRKVFKRWATELRFSTITIEVPL